MSGTGSPVRLACGAHGALSATHLTALTQLLSADGRALVTPPRHQ
ncbi:hypothetical protein OG264_22790 [Streptomyces xanthophaeus]|nr:hypothetical protein OG264_22790 [Streptomyces xanthophaeus]WST60954.1 hypothetical protein OG605_15655 [Streptomyces xanthophaeus]